MLRFTIRDVLWLTTVVALALGLVVLHRQSSSLAAQNALLKSHKQFLWKHLEEAGFKVHNNLDGGSGISIRRPRSGDQPKTSRGRSATGELDLVRFDRR